MKKILVLIIFLLSQVILAQDNQNLSKPKKKSNLDDGLGKEFYFWGHIQQYKAFIKEDIDNSIIIKYPDFRAERYVDGKLVEEVKCEGKPYAIYDVIKKILKCPTFKPGDGIYILNESLLKFGFKKEDLRNLLYAEKMIGFIKIILKYETNGFELNIDIAYPEDWRGVLNTYKKYEYSCNDCPYVFVEAELLERVKDENGNLTVAIKPIITEKKEKEKDYTPCQEYEYDLLTEKRIKCPYHVPFGDWDIKSNESLESLKRHYPYLFQTIVYDYNLPH